MTAVIAALIQTAVRFLFFLAVAALGIFCGKKYRDLKKQ